MGIHTLDKLSLSHIERCVGIPTLDKLSLSHIVKADEL